MMSSTLTVGRPIRQDGSVSLGISRPLIVAASALILGAFLSFSGLAWDVEWHNRVGPDTFFTLPHLVLYSGVAISGLASLFAALWYAWERREPGATAIGLVGDAWGAPLGFVVAGLGAVVFLTFGLFDLWWHTIYGFDVTFLSPPHIGLLAGAQITVIGGQIALAAQMRHAQRQSAFALSALGLALVTAIALGSGVPFQEVLPPFVPGLNFYKLTAALVYVAALLMVASAVRRAGIASLIGLFVVLLGLAARVFVEWATPVYAASVNLFIRDNAPTYAVLPEYLAPAVLAAGVLVDLGLLAARRAGLSLRVAVPAVGALAGLLIAALFNPAFHITSETVDLINSQMPATLLAAMPVGAFAGWLGWQLGLILRGNPRSNKE
jgi:hypothetical protein